MEGQWSRKRSYVMEWKQYGEFTYLGDTVNVGGGYEAVVSVRTRCGCVKLRDCGKLW